MPSWRIVQSKKQIAKKTKLALVILALVLGLLLLAQAVKFTQTLFSPWKLSASDQRNIFWNGDFNINLLVRSEKISLVSFSPAKGEISIINIPDELFIETSHGFGKWQLRSIYDLGGSKLLKDSMTSFFALPIDGVVEGDLTNMIKEKGFSLFNISTLKTDLTLYELIKLQRGLSKVRFDKIKQIDLELEKNILADGTVVLVADSVRMDSLFSDMIDPNIASEHKTIAIFNSTEHSQLAQKAARLITNIGGEVIIVSNGKNRYQKTAISGEKSKTLNRIKQIFKTSDTIDPKDEDLISSRAQINLFLGEDYFNEL